MFTFYLKRNKKSRGYIVKWQLDKTVHLSLLQKYLDIFYKYELKFVCSDFYVKYRSPYEESDMF